MSKLNKPTTTRLRSKTGVVENAFRNSIEDSNKSEQWMYKQAMIDDWNNNYVGKKSKSGMDLEKFFDDVYLDGMHLIIHMYMENVIKDYYVVDDAEGNKGVQIIPGISQIDGRKRNTDVPTWIDTPFPLIDKGVIMAISPQVQLYYYELKEKMAKYNKELADSIIIPKRGDVVYTNHFLFKEARYYFDKNAKTKDFIKSQEDIRLNEFDYLFKVSNFEIESIVRPDKENEMFDKPKFIVKDISDLHNQLTK